MKLIRVGFTLIERILVASAITEPYTLYYVPVNQSNRLISFPWFSMAILVGSLHRFSTNACDLRTWLNKKSIELFLLIKIPADDTHTQNTKTSSESYQKYTRAT